MWSLLHNTQLQSSGTKRFLRSAKPHSHVANITRAFRLQEVCWVFVVLKLFEGTRTINTNPSRFSFVHNRQWVACMNLRHEKLEFRSKTNKLLQTADVQKACAHTNKKLRADRHLRYHIHRSGRRLVAGLSSQRAGYNPRPVYVGFVVEKVARGYVFLRVCRVPLSVSLHYCSTLIHLCITDAIKAWSLQLATPFNDTHSPAINCCV
jgi:hypothetical protein